MAAPPKLDVGSFILRLRTITSAANLDAIAKAEQRFAQEAITKLNGYATISSAFKSFFIDTIDVVNHVWGPHASTVPQSYVWLFPRITQAFHWLCGADQQAKSGYYYPAFAQLRNIFDSAVVTSAVAQNLSSFTDAEGLTEGAPFDPNAVRKKRIDVERSIFRQMTGAASGLSPATRDELEKLGWMFDWETHGQRMLAIESMAWMKREGPLRVLPHFTAETFVLFANRYFETMWMVHRLVPLMRPHAAPLPDDWRNKWIILDQSIHQNVFSLTEQLGLKIGQAFVEFVATKFPFDAASALKP